MAKTKAKAKDAISNARPVVERLAQDDEFRKHLVEAFAAARTAYDQIGNGRSTKTVAAKLASDKHVQKELRKTVEEVQKAAKRARRKSKSHKRRNALILAGVVVGLLYNPVTGGDTRRWIREKVVGPDETFEYEGLSTN